MTKIEFFNLLKKFEQGTCSTEEEQLLHRFCDEVQIKGLEDAWEFSEKERTRVRLLNRIMNIIQSAEEENKENRVKVWQIAAAALVLFACGFIYWQLSLGSEQVIPSEDAIVLELPDGEMKIIKESGSEIIKGRNGSVVGNRINKTLVYQSETSSVELEYHVLHVPYGKRFQLELSDGSKVHLNAGSSLRYPIQFLQGKNRQVFVKGEAYFDVSRDSIHPFVVNADQLDIQVLGTKFNVHAYGEDDTSHVVLVEGAVGLSTSTGSIEGHKVVLSPGQMGSFDKANQAIVTATVASDIYTSWMQGKLVFRDMPFENILKKLERHYDVTIINQNPKLAKEKFNASFDATTIVMVFESLKKYHGINYLVEKDTIIIK